MSKLKKPVPQYEDIRALVLSARQTIARGVDLLQVHTNYEIGRRIFEQEQHGADSAEYGIELLNELAARLTGSSARAFHELTLRRCASFTLPTRIGSHELSRHRQDNSKGEQFTRHCLGNCQDPQSSRRCLDNRSFPALNRRPLSLAG